MIQSTPELLPCPNPWCDDSDPSLFETPQGEQQRVICLGCDLAGPLEETEAEAIAAWNTRSTAKAQPAKDGLLPVIQADRDAALAAYQTFLQTIRDGEGDTLAHAFARHRIEHSNPGRRRLSEAPCDQCGYNGPGYYQPETHPCAGNTHSTPDRNAVLEEAVYNVEEALKVLQTSHPAARILRGVMRDLDALTTPEPTDPARVSRPSCETCSKDVPEVLCPTCAKWWNDNPLPAEVSGLADALEACDGWGPNLTPYKPEGPNTRAFHVVPGELRDRILAALRTPSPAPEVAKEALPDRRALRHEICELIEAYAPNHDPLTGLPVGSEVEQLTNLILAALQTINERSNHD